ncbi:SOS response-associated peptidase [soil metagenome]
MCNLYSMTKSQAAIRNLFKVDRDSSGNLPSLPAIFPDNPAPVVGTIDGERELTMMRWGMPGPPQFGGAPITNIRNTKSPHWRGSLMPANRCLVPATSFSEYNDVANPKSLKNPDGSPHPLAGKKDVVWFALNEERPLFAFAGIWTNWHGVRGTKSNPIEGPHRVFGFLTTDPNSIVGPIHAKAMPVILREDEWATWLTAPPEHALRLQTPLPDDELQIVARGAAKQDAAL